MLLVSILICGISIANVMGKAIDIICRLVTCTFRSLIAAPLSIKSVKLSYFAAQIQNVNPSFAIRPAVATNTETHLLIEAGPAGLSFVIEDDDHFFSALVAYAFPLDMNSNELAAAMEEIIQNEPILKRQFKKTDIVWAFPEALLVPNEWMNPATAWDMLKLVHGDLNQGEVKSDFMFKHNMHTVYRIPATVAEVFAKHFLFANQTHQYAVLPDLFPNDANQLYVIFYNNRLTAMLHKENKLQAMQSFSYQNAEDAAYHLLNICRAFDVAPNDVVLKCSGMIDEQSNLFAMIYKYFLTIKLLEHPENVSLDEAIKKYPPHFFSHLFATALCV